MELIGIQRARGRDLATGIVLGAGFGLAALFLYLGTTSTSTTGATITDPVRLDLRARHRDPPLVARSSGSSRWRSSSSLYRPLLLDSVSPELAAARGDPGPAGRRLYLLAMAVAVALSRRDDRRDPQHRAAHRTGGRRRCGSPTRPGAAIARRRPDRRRPRCGSGSCSPMTATTGRRCTTGWPVSFFVVTADPVAYLLSATPRRRADARGGDRCPMFSGFMVNAWIVATHRRGRRRRGRVLRRPAGSAFVAHADPERLVRRRRRRQPDRRQHAHRPRRLLARRRARHRAARPARAP